MPPSEPPSTGTLVTDQELELRRALTGLHELLATSMRMHERHDVDEVIDLLVQSVEAVTRCQLVRVGFRHHEEWATWPPGQATKPYPGPGARTRLEDHGDHWTCTTAVAALSGSAGRLVLRHPTRPDDEQVLVIERLGHLLGAALVDADIRERDQRRAAELSSVNTQLVCTMTTLRHREAVQEEFIHLAASGTELDMATSLSRLTGRAVVLRDRFAHETTRFTLASGSTVSRTGVPLVALIGGRPELGTVELLMPTEKGHGDDDDTFALHHASVALGVLRAHAAAMGEMVNRLSRDLLEDLVTGIPVEVAVGRAAAQGHDLRARHDLLVSMWSSDTGRRASDRDVDRIRTAMAHQRLPCLTTRTEGMVVVLVHHGVDIGQLYEDLCRSHGDANGVIAKGEPISSPEHIPHAYEQAQRALTARRQSNDPRGSVAYCDLGVERILALDGNRHEVERLIDDWLADLMSYDDGHDTDLVNTLATYLDLGGRYDDTARALTVHRNTLRYRLSRIAEISGHDLADVDTKLNLHLALRAWRLRRPGIS